MKRRTFIRDCALVGAGVALGIPIIKQLTGHFVQDGQVIASNPIVDNGVDYVTNGRLIQFMPPRAAKSTYGTLVAPAKSMHLVVNADGSTEVVFS